MTTDQSRYDTSASDAVLARLMKLHPKLIDLSLDRMHSILEALGNPQDKLPPVIHVAGTNGKGSTTATIRAIAEAAGHRVHVYTSPHLVRFAERIRIAGKIIEEDALTELLERCEEATGGEPITFFEITTAAALLAFSETPADLCILEVGLGGRLDATNVVAKPACTVITPISIDHEQFLGDTITAIAGEKAGIIKEGSPLVVGPQPKDALTRINEIAAARNVKPLHCDEAWHAEAIKNGEGFLFEDWKTVLSLPSPNLAGDHQILNAATAIAALHAQKAVHIPDAAIKAGLGWVRWPARMESLNGSSLHKILPEEADLWLDGGHNPAAARIIKSHLRKLDPVEKSVTLILGMMGTKDAAGYLKSLSGVIDRVIAVAIPGEENTAEPSFLAAAATDIGISGTIAKDVESALKMVANQPDLNRKQFVLIGGSLYLAGHVLREAELYPE
ncbi:bifunctional folylpolyglutamate synthase/dihydrofolate synthase [Kordiimonas laminariae]|uniref:bifunctional folylpolyglutamate synthase/dihydrofolate synthase n=1 Tax=Kordiimonas laminariae TaxID=2917717 RepID=UPI001FF2366F|nr:folylpolyglutamate synthase/dihydrofolate synthase family protein [Kordiimonas laminariae]MCK0069243.1 bifunctional folylpolyglutamate synthase/dihydrofolate synthase [Kordiimonas laminariae]